MKIAVGITGASGCFLGFKLAYEISKNHETYVVISESAKTTLKLENGINFNKEKQKLQKATILDDKDIGACVASGSFGIQKTIIAPCSINTLAKISNGFCDTLITRMAAVALKEQKRLVLGVREMPFSNISLKQMSELSSLNVMIAPPVFGFYSKSQSFDDICDFIVGKWLDTLEIENSLYKRWN
ncbi:UbiX family flavin prenyltransferase [Campylobacter pinnipediorum]|uniref:UbiX family flavin prenyltransferase n=1 Tax=Campylobacter pinnipediorum TaxID=1965231 RepID=UPI00084D55AC|nr:UbiX family flavin prenyltransferase [Campylobacter pinnipediorum]AQW84336.1 3-octaprenyl-4-hydroxybenzoate carboxy-lyase [Campylobacter pinnipediorum subsp. pinnipediorum]